MYLEIAALFDGASIERASSHYPYITFRAKSEREIQGQTARTTPYPPFAKYQSL
jgi:hypothetical protein